MDERSSIGDLQAQLDEIWAGYLHEVTDRLAQLRATGHAARAGTLSDEARLEAAECAHQLAGMCGAFGRAQLAGRARATEQWLRSPGGDADALLQLVEQMHAMAAAS